jgi:hypothetical protein
MNRREWREFLKLYSREFLSFDWSDTIRHHSTRGAVISEQARRAGWMGFEPASEAAISAAEDRLGRRLPPSLRTFYEVSNGWGMVGPFVFDVLPVEKIGWLKDVKPNLYEIACDIEGRRKGRPYDDARRQQHWLDQGTRVKRSVAISSWGDAAMWLLDPGGQAHTADWPGGSWASWGLGMDWTSESFAALMRDEMASNRYLKSK